MTNHGKCKCGRSSSQCNCPRPPAVVEATSRIHNTESEQFADVGHLVETIVLGDVMLQSLIEANFRLPAFARSIRLISRRVRLTNCRVIPVLENPRLADVLVEGVIHLHYQYVSDVSRVVRDYSVNVPFNIYERVELAEEIETIFGGNVANVELQQIDDLENGLQFSNSSMTFEVFNEPVELRLLAAAVYEREMEPIRDRFNRFNEINIVFDLYLALQLTQRQRFPDSPIPTFPPDPTPQPSRSIFERLRQLLRR